MLSVWLAAALSTSQSKWHHQFSASMFSPVSRGGQNFSHNHQQLCTYWMVQFADGVVTFWAGLPAHPVLVYYANLDGLTLNTWRWDDSSPFWDAPFPWPGVLDAHSPSLCSVWRLNRQGRGPTMHLPCVPILTSLLPLQLAFTHCRLLTVCVVGLIWLSPLL